MNELQIFKFEETKAIRTINKSGDPWFIAKDLCDVLEIKSAKNAVARLDGDERGVFKIPTSGGVQQVSIVNESGMYSLVLSSRKPEARAFKKWLTSEVIPAIRRTGSYMAPVVSQAELIFKMAEQGLDHEKTLIVHDDRLSVLEKAILENRVEAVQVPVAVVEAVIEAVAETPRQTVSVPRAADMASVNEFLSFFSIPAIRGLSQGIGREVTNYCERNNLPMSSRPVAKNAATHVALYPKEALKEIVSQRGLI